MPDARYLSCLLILPLAAGCGGGGGGGSSAAKGPPTLLTASLVESGTPNNSPDPGEFLDLYLDEDVALIAGVLLTDADFALSSGTLGNVTAAPLLVSNRRVRITLGAGVSFTPGSTTVSFAALGQDAVRSTTSNKLAAGGTPVTVRVGDGSAPVLANLTLNGIPAALNGTGAAAGTLLVPRNGFVLTVDVTDAGNNIDPNGFQITANQPVVADGATVLAGLSLTPFLTNQGRSGNTWSFLVPANVSFPVATVTVTVTAFDDTGLGSTPATFTFQATTADDGMRPFETSVNPRQTWFIDLSRDIEAITSAAGTPIPISYTDGANSVPDLEEVLRVVGLLSATPIANLSGSSSSNDVVMDVLKSDMLVELALLFPGVNITYTFTNPGSFPGTLQPSYAAATFSRICLAGRSSISGTLGVALFDTRNAHQDDDCAHPGSSPSYTLRLGVFLDTLVAFPSAGINSLSGTAFRQTYDPFIKFRGTPIGEGAGDGTRLLNILGGTPGDVRQTRMQLALTRMARFLAVVVAHETGHSMGLVKDGAQPTGFYGGDAVHFPSSTSGHIDLAASGLFPAGAQEVMAPSISFDEALSASTAFNALELAYLRERSFCNGN